MCCQGRDRQRGLRLNRRPAHACGILRGSRRVARGFGFRNTMKAASEEEIKNVMKQPRKGLTFIHALAIPGNKDARN
jgi:hypothetical protein